MKTLLSWSSGKDSAWALHVLRARGVQPAGLLTTINEAFNRVAMHGVRRELVEAQARAAGLPLWPIPLPWPCSNSEYEVRMVECCRAAVAAGIEAVAFGDLFLRDVREYRERQLQDTGLRPMFPLWDIPTDALSRDMIAGGLRATLVCVDPRKLPRDFAGREFDHKFLADLPAGVDPCGENGEFHTFCWDAPAFSAPIPVAAGDACERDGFVFVELT